MGEESKSTDSEFRRRDYDAPRGGAGIDNKFLMPLAIGAIFGSVATYAYLSGHYRLVEQEKYDQLVRGAVPVADTAAQRPAAAPAPAERPAPPVDNGNRPPRNGGSDDADRAPASGEFIGEVEEFDLKGSASKGPADAKVTLIEFSDFQCPACSHWDPSIAKLVKARGDKVRVVFKHLPLPNHENARNAAYAAEAAKKQGKFWEMADLLFQNQQNLSVSELARYAGQLSLNVEKFKKDMDSPEVRDLVNRDFREAERAVASSEKRGVPAFFINGRRADVATPEQLGALIDKSM